MLAVGLTGGIGCGKSTVAALLEEQGAVVVDADVIARQVVEPGRPAHRAVVERFGTGVLAPDGTLDRAALAGVVFSDPDALAALNAITHPAIGAAMLEERSRHAGSDRVVVFDIPLLEPVHRELLGLDLVVVVDAPTTAAVTRLVEQRGLDRADAEARVAAQPSRAARVGHADIVVDNAGDREVLERRVAELGAELERRARG